MNAPNDPMPIEKSTQKPVPPALIPSLERYAYVMNRAGHGGVYWRVARKEMRCAAVFLAWRLFGADVPEAEALERVRFSAGFETCWVEGAAGAEHPTPNIQHPTPNEGEPEL